MQLRVFIHVSWWTTVCHEAVFTADILTHHSGKSTGVADTNDDGSRQSSAPISHGGVTVSQACTKPAPWNWSTWVKFRVGVDYSHLCLYLNTAAGNLPDTVHKPCCIYPLFKNIMPLNSVSFFVCCSEHGMEYQYFSVQCIKVRNSSYSFSTVYGYAFYGEPKTTFPLWPLLPPFWKGDWPGVRPLLGCMHLYQSLTKTIG